MKNLNYGKYFPTKKIVERFDKKGLKEAISDYYKSESNVLDIPLDIISGTETKDQFMDKYGLIFGLNISVKVIKMMLKNNIDFSVRTLPLLGNNREYAEKELRRKLLLLAIFEELINFYAPTILDMADISDRIGKVNSEKFKVSDILRNREDKLNDLKLKLDMLSNKENQEKKIKQTTERISDLEKKITSLKESLTNLEAKRKKIKSEEEQINIWFAASAMKVADDLMTLFSEATRNWELEMLEKVFPAATKKVADK